MNKIIVEVDFQNTELTVIEKENGLFDVCVGEEVKHPNADAKAVMRALGNYIHGLNYQIQKLTK